MSSPINNSNWPGPNAAGMGRTPFPAVASDGTGLCGTLYSGEGVSCKTFVTTGPNVVGAMPTNPSTAGLPLTGQIN